MVHAIANVKISSQPGLARNAIERSLNMTPRQIGAVAQQTLEGVLREVVAELTPEEVNEDRLKFAGTLIRHAKDDFDKLGIELDAVSYTHLRAHETVLDLVCRLLLEKKKKPSTTI